MSRAPYLSALYNEFFLKQTLFIFVKNVNQIILLCDVIELQRIVIQSYRAKMKFECIA